MHFIPTLFGMLLFYPLFRVAVRHPILGVGVLVGLVVKAELDGFIYPEFWGTDALPYIVRAAKILTYAGYGMVAGAAYGIYRTRRGRELEAWIAPIAYLGGLLLIIKAIGSYKTIINGAYPFDYTGGYWADFLMPVLLFLLCMSLGSRSWPDILSKLAPFSFGIYLCHPIFLDLAEIVLGQGQLSPTVQVLAKIGFIVPATALFVVALGRLPLLAWTIGLGPLPGLPHWPAKQKGM